MRAGRRPTEYLPVLCALCVLLLTGCGAKAAETRGQILVGLIAAEHASADAWRVSIPRGGDAVFTIRPDEGWFFDGADYENAQVEELGANAVRVTLHGVPHSMRVGFSVVKARTMIRYHPNAGEADGLTDYYEQYDITRRKRPNTSQGTQLHRDGYTLLCWNTAPDGTGEDVGLGSRVTMPESGVLDLYARWVPWTDPDRFTFIPLSGGAEVTGYRGDAAQIVVPEMLGGREVIHIAAGAFTDVACDSVVLPPTVQSIAPGAFQSCSLTELWLSDGVMTVSDDSFADCPNFSTVHINAVQTPAYADRSRHSCYADKLDLLILSLREETPRMVFFAGSSMWFSLDGRTVEEYFGGAYRVVNIALNGFYCGMGQFEIAESCLREGDVFVHAPEVCSAHQFLYTDAMTANFYTCLELNYDLFSRLDIRHLTGVFDAFQEYQQAREGLPRTGYDALPRTDWMDDYGCINIDRPPVNGDEDLLDDAYIAQELLTDEAFARLNTQYARIRAVTGNPVLFSFGPVNLHGLPEADRDEAVWQAFEDRVREGLSDDAAVVTSLKDMVLPGSSFYYTDFHLNTEASVPHTLRLCGEIEQGLEGRP